MLLALVSYLLSNLLLCPVSRCLHVAGWSWAIFRKQMRCKRCSQPKTESVCLHMAISICMCMCTSVESIHISYIYVCPHVCEHTILWIIYIHIHMYMYPLASNHAKYVKKNVTSFVARSPWTQQGCILANARKKLVHVTQIMVVECHFEQKKLARLKCFFWRMPCAAVRLQIHLSFWWFGHLNIWQVEKPHNHIQTRKPQS